MTDEEYQRLLRDVRKRERELVRAHKLSVTIFTVMTVVFVFLAVWGAWLKWGAP